MFFWRKKKSKFDEPQAEPLFMAVPSIEEELSHAYARAAGSMAEFKAHIERQGDHICSAKLRFKDPNESDRTGKDVLLGADSRWCAATLDLSSTPCAIAR